MQHHTSQEDGMFKANSQLACVKLESLDTRHFEL